MNKILEYRTKNGLTQAKMAALFGVSQQAIALFEAGHKKPGWALTLRIEETAGISRHDLRPDIYPRDRAA